MLQRKEFVAELIGAIRGAAESGEAGRTEPELNALANQIVSVLASRSGRDLHETFEAVEACFTEILTRDGAADHVFDDRALTDELRGYVRLLAVALQRQHPEMQGEGGFNLNPTDVLILNVLEQAGPLSGRELADHPGIGVTAETIARRLPLLRLQGLVASYRKGKATMNLLTEHGRAAVPIAVGVTPRMNGTIGVDPARGR
ncbi:MAG TPA: hypothetical protein VGC56_11965 [Allosphingosinicella sp.]